MEEYAMPGWPDAPYSRAIKAGGLLYVSGNVGVDPETGKVPEGGIQAQTRQSLDNLKATVEMAGLSFDDVVKVNVYLLDVRDFDAMNAVYREYFPEHRPARTTVGVKELAGEDYLIEIELTALQK